MNEPKKISGPWYKHFREYSALVDRYLRAYRNVPKDASHHEEFKNFHYFMETKLVYESNLIEGAGLGEGETRQLVNKYFPNVPSHYSPSDDFSSPFQWFHQEVPKFYGWFHQMQGQGRIGKKFVPSIVFEGGSKGAIEVARHFAALAEGTITAAKFRLSHFRYHHAREVKEFRETREQRQEWWSDMFPGEKFPNRVRRPILFSESRIKKLHRIISKGLLPDDSKVAPGEYRIDKRMVGSDVVFPSPNLVPLCMKKFVADANRAVFDVPGTPENGISAAARISYDFVRIHPFPDFNGRVSRLLLMMVLQVAGVPFPVTLRGSKKERHRYLQSLNKANNGHLEPYEALIAYHVMKSFEEIDENITRAGLPSILTFDPGESSG